jgi:hypothetical protein
MMTTVSKLHKMLGALLEQGHGRKPIVVNKPSFYDAREGDGCVLLEVFGIDGPRWIPMADDDGGTKWNADGTESGKQVVVLFGCMGDTK